MEFQAKWIQAPGKAEDVCPVFCRTWKSAGTVKKAELYLTALGVYEARLNGRRVSEYVLAPGWTVYEKRLQYQKYDVTEMLEEENELNVTVGKGWFPLICPGGWSPKTKPEEQIVPWEFWESFIWNTRMAAQL